MTMWHHHHSPCATLGEFGVGQPRPRSPPLALFCASGPRSWPSTGHHSHAIHYRHTHARTHTYLDTYIHTHTVCRAVTPTQSPSRPCRTPMHHRARRKCHSRGRHGRPGLSFPLSSPSLSPVSQASLVCTVRPPAVVNWRCSCVRVDQTAESAASTVRLSYFPRHGRTEGG